MSLHNYVCSCALKKVSILASAAILVLLSSPYAAAGQYIIPLNDFSFTATGPIGLGRAAVATVDNNGYQMVESSVQITASTVQQSQIVVDYIFDSTIVDGVYTTTIEVNATMYLYFDLLLTDIDPNYDYYGKLDGGAYRFLDVAATANLVNTATTPTTATFTVSATGTDIDATLAGISLALNVDVNGVDENLAPVDATVVGLEGYLDVIKFNSNDFMTAYSNIVFSLANGLITYDPTPAILSGGVQDDYLDPEFSFLMTPQKILTPNEIDLLKQEVFIERFYQKILGRSADEGGMTHWKKIIKDESSAMVSRGFFDSPEFINKDLNNTDFLYILYQTLFDRQPDDGGFYSWMEQLNNNELRKMVIYGFLKSQEFSELSKTFSATPFSANDEAEYQVSLFVKRFYTLVLNRQPDVGGFNNWVNELKDGTRSGGEIANGFFMSTEFTNRQANDNDFVDICYQAFFDRTADIDGKTNWLNDLSSGSSRTDILNGFINSQEFINLSGKYGIRAK